MPYKRFATPWLLSVARQYLNIAEGNLLNRKQTTYRSVLQHGRQKIGYPLRFAKSTNSGDAMQSEEIVDSSAKDTDDPPPDPFHQPVIPASLLWRFVGWLGGLSGTLDKLREMILQRNPNSTCHRVLGSVDPGKARSDARLEKLETARQLLLIIPEWESHFGRSPFPQFATRGRFW